MPTTAPPQLVAGLPPGAAAGFASLLQYGFLLAVDKPVALLPLLLTLPGFTAVYLEKTVQTVFINGIAADRLDQPLSGGSTVALSAAMPGLAGAIFRRLGIHGVLRGSQRESTREQRENPGYLTLKLFNSIATDRVADLLQGGILVRGPVLHDFLRQRPELLRPPAAWRFAGGQEAGPELLPAIAACPMLELRANSPANG